MRVWHSDTLSDPLSDTLRSISHWWVVTCDNNLRFDTCFSQFFLSFFLLLFDSLKIRIIVVHVSCSIKQFPSLFHTTWSCLLIAFFVRSNDGETIAHVNMIQFRLIFFSSHVTLDCMNVTCHIHAIDLPHLCAHSLWTSLLDWLSFAVPLNSFLYRTFNPKSLIRNWWNFLQIRSLIW